MQRNVNLTYEYFYLKQGDEFIVQYARPVDGQVKYTRATDAAKSYKAIESARKQALRYATATKKSIQICNSEGMPIETVEPMPISIN